MGRYALVVGADKHYIKGITALIKSSRYYQPDVDIILLYNDIPENIIAMADLAFKSTEKLAYKRFDIAIDAVNNYKSICLMDADMFFTADCKLFFNIASHGFIVTGSNGMIINFNKAYQQTYNISLGVDEYLYTKCHTTAPIFINNQNIDWFKDFLKLTSMSSFDDFLLLNLLGIKMNKPDKMLCMPPYCFTGIHHWQVKPETALIKKGEQILSGTEEAVYMIHGKWWDKGWLDDMFIVMEGYFKNNNMGHKCKNMMENAFNISKTEFEKWLQQ